MRIIHAGLVADAFNKDGSVNKDKNGNKQVIYRMKWQSKSKYSPKTATPVKK